MAALLWQRVDRFDSPGEGDFDNVRDGLSRQLVSEGMPVGFIAVVLRQEVPQRLAFDAPTPSWKTRAQEKLAGLDLAALQRAGPLQTMILQRTKRLLVRLLRSAKKPLDLEGVDLIGVRLLAGTYPPMNFARSIVGSLDISEATLDADSLASLNRATYSTFPPWHATPAQRQVIDRKTR